MIGMIRRFFLRCAAWLGWPLLAAAAAVAQAEALELPPGFEAQTLATNLNAMTAMAVAPDGRVFLADQTGKLLVWKDGQVIE